MAGDGRGARTVRVRVAYGELGGAVDRVTALLEAGEAVVVELSGPGAADLATLGALARLELAARRCDGRLCTRAPDDDLPRLAALTGLARVLRVERSGQPGGQP